MRGAGSSENAYSEDGGDGVGASINRPLFRIVVSFVFIVISRVAGFIIV